MLSVVMPNYNQGIWLTESLSALLAQSRQPDEIIVVDDASNDDSLSRIAAFQARTDKITLIRHAQNKGATEAINTGLAAARGAFIHCAAADDRVLPGLFSTALAALEGAPQAAFFCARVALIDQAGAFIGSRPFIAPASRAGYLSPADVRRRIRSSDNWIVGPSVVYRRESLAAIGGFDASLGSLSDGMAGRLMAFQSGFYFSPAILSCWRIYPESYSNSAARSVDRTLELVALGKAAIRRTFPDDVRGEYEPLFERRHRFNAARLALTWSGRRPDVATIAATAGFGPAGRAVLETAARLPMARAVISAYLTARLRPFAAGSVATAALRAWTGGARGRTLIASAGSGSRV